MKPQNIPKTLIQQAAELDEESIILKHYIDKISLLIYNDCGIIAYEIFRQKMLRGIRHYSELSAIIGVKKSTIYESSSAINKCLIARRKEIESIIKSNPII